MFVLNTPVVEMPRSGRRAAMVTIVISSHAQNIIEAAGPAENISLTVSGGRSSDAERMLFIERLYDARFLPTAEHMVWSAEVEKNYIDH